MNGEQVISDELWQEAIIQLQQGNNWMVHNRVTYFLEREDAFFLQRRKMRKFLLQTI